MGLLTSWLLGLMTKDVMLLLDGMETAYDVWNSLEEKLLMLGDGEKLPYSSYINIHRKSFWVLFVVEA